ADPRGNRQDAGPGPDRDRTDRFRRNGLPAPTGRAPAKPRRRITLNRTRRTAARLNRQGRFIGRNRRRHQTRRRVQSFISALSAEQTNFFQRRPACGPNLQQDFILWRTIPMTSPDPPNRCNSAPPISRRAFSRMATLLAAGATLPFYNENALAQLSKTGPIPPDAVKINANENPLGPCPEAAEAIAKVIAKGGRYLYEETDTFAGLLAEQEGLYPDYVLPFPGSRLPLHHAMLEYTTRKKPFVVADPGYEAGAPGAQFVG